MKSGGNSEQSGCAVEIMDRRVCNVGREYFSSLYL